LSRWAKSYKNVIKNTSGKKAASKLNLLAKVIYLECFSEHQDQVTIALKDTQNKV